MERLRKQLQRMNSKIDNSSSSNSGSTRSLGLTVDDSQSSNVTSATAQHQMLHDSSNASSHDGASRSRLNLGRGGSGGGSTSKKKSSALGRKQSRGGGAKVIVQDPLDTDILLGRSKASWNHVGNRRFRVFVGLHLKQYMEASTRLEKTMVVNLVVEAIQDAGGRFLKQEKPAAGKEWYVVTNKMAREKVGHALRDAVGNRIKITTDDSAINAAVMASSAAGSNQSKNSRNSAGNAMVGSNHGAGGTSGNNSRSGNNAFANITKGLKNLTKPRRRQSNIMMERRRSSVVLDPHMGMLGQFVAPGASGPERMAQAMHQRESKSCNDLVSQSDLVRDAKKVALELGEEEILQEIEGVATGSGSSTDLRTRQTLLMMEPLKVSNAKGMESLRRANHFSTGVNSNAAISRPKPATRVKTEEILDSGEFSLMSINREIFHDQDDPNHHGHGQDPSSAGFAVHTKIFDDYEDTSGSIHPNSGNVDSGRSMDTKTREFVKQVDRRVVRMEVSEELRALAGSSRNKAAGGKAPILSLPLEEVSSFNKPSHVQQRNSSKASRFSKTDISEFDISEDFSIMSIGDGKATNAAPNASHIASKPAGTAAAVAEAGNASIKTPTTSNKPAQSQAKRPSKPMEVKAKPGWEMDISDEFSISSKAPPANAKLQSSSGPPPAQTVPARIGSAEASTYSSPSQLLKGSLLSSGSAGSGSGGAPGMGGVVGEMYNVHNQDIRGSFSDIEFSEELSFQGGLAGKRSSARSSTRSSAMRVMLSGVMETTAEDSSSDFSPRPLAEGPLSGPTLMKGQSISVPLNDLKQDTEKTGKAHFASSPLGNDQSDAFSVDTENEWNRTLQALSSRADGS